MSTNIPAPKYTENFKIHTYEVDLSNRLTIQSLCQYLQEAASNHAGELGLGVEYLLKNRRTWLLSRLAVEMDQPVALGETITIKTWPAGNKDFFFIRDFEIENSEGLRIGIATSYWIFLDTAKRRPIHPLRSTDDSGVITSLQLYKDIPRSFTRQLGRIPQLTHKTVSKSFTVRYSDLDLNNHVNNIIYIAWAMEGIDPEYKEDHIPVSLEINFLSEVTYGDTVDLSLEVVSESEYIHSISSANSEVCRVKTGWERLNP